MKKIRIVYVLLSAVLLLGAFSCREKETIADDLVIPGLGGTEETANELDKWLYENFTLPYNIEVVYRWDAAQMYSNITTSRLVPVEFDLVQPMMAVIRDVWFDPFFQAAGSKDFLCRLAPKKVVLVGSPEYQGGSIKLGQAEGGRKILLMNVNTFDAQNEEQVRSFLHVILHEFGHIMHQTIMFDKSFQDISAGFYDSSGWKNYDVGKPNYNNPEAFQRGFTRNYGMNNKDDDFVEVFSMVLVYGKDWFDNVVCATAQQSTITDAYGALTQKLALVESYMRDTWGIEMFDDEMGNKGLETYVQEAIATVLATPLTE